MAGMFALRDAGGRGLLAVKEGRRRGGVRMSAGLCHRTDC